MNQSCSSSYGQTTQPISQPSDWQMDNHCRSRCIPNLHQEQNQTKNNVICIISNAKRKNAASINIGKTIKQICNCINIKGHEKRDNSVLLGLINFNVQISTLFIITRIKFCQLMASAHHNYSFAISLPSDYIPGRITHAREYCR